MLNQLQWYILCIYVLKRGMKKKILITDDDEGVQDIFKLIFERAGYHVEIHGEASSILENNYTYPDLFLLDRQLSGQDGLKVCRFLKSQSQTKDIPVIIVSATPGIGKLAQEAGADDFIEKPFQMKELLNVVAKWI
jgi:DNA-binding response OmpR family regulator